MHGLNIKNFKSVYLTAAFFSVLLSVWSALKESVINTDAICYLQSAETMREGLWTAMHLCGQAQWPFFSALIYGLSKLLHCSSLVSAYVLDGLFSLLSVLIFLRIIQFLKPSLRVLWLAAAVILLAHEFNSIRVYIVRDHGFWAFYLSSILLLLRYFANPRGYLAIGWNMSLLIAMLFRIEGLLFLLLVPFVAWFDIYRSRLSRLKEFLQLNALMIVMGGLLLLITLLQANQDLGRVEEVKFQLTHGIQVVLQHFDDKAQALATHVLSGFSRGDAGIVLLLMLMSWYLFSVITNVSTVYAVLVIYAWFQKLLSNKVLWAYLIVNILITSMFLVENMFLSKRYLLALSLVLMMWVPFALDHLIERKRKWPLMLAAFFMFIASLGGIFDFGHSKSYIRQAGEWLEENVPVNASLYSNDYQVMYYSHHFGNTIFEKAPIFSSPNAIENEQWKQYDYVAIRSHYKNATIEIPLAPIQVFKNKRGDQVSIYKILH